MRITVVAGMKNNRQPAFHGGVYVHHALTVNVKTLHIGMKFNSPQSQPDKPFNFI